MTAAVSAANLFLGIAYLALAALVLWELVRGWGQRGTTHFGLALAAIAFTCGPHHIVHGMHVGFEGQRAGRLDLITVLVGLPPALIFLRLRVEALFNGPGDRLVAETPGWLHALPVAFAAYTAAVVTAGASMITSAPSLSVEGGIGLAAAGVFGTIGVLLVRTQVRNRREAGGWSLSGLMLSGLFVTCSVMHVAMAMEVTARARALDLHLVAVDTAAVGAALWFLYVVRDLLRQARAEWDAIGAAPTALI